MGLIFGSVATLKKVCGPDGKTCLYAIGLDDPDALVSLKRFLDSGEARSGKWLWNRQVTDTESGSVEEHWYEVDGSVVESLIPPIDSSETVALREIQKTAPHAFTYNAGWGREVEVEVAFNRCYGCGDCKMVLSFGDVAEYDGCKLCFVCLFQMFINV